MQPLPDIRKILILRFSSLGDILMTTAVPRCLRKAYPNAQIDMVVRADFLDLIRENPHLNHKIGLPRGGGRKGLFSLLHDINAEKYDLVYDAHRSLRTRILMPLIQAPHKAYTEKHYVRRSLALTFKLPLLPDKRRLLERLIDPLERFGVKCDGLGPELHLVPGALEQALAILNFTPPTGRPIVGIVPSAQWPGKRWPLSYFRKLLEDYVRDTKSLLIVFGGKEDTFCTELCAGLPSDRVLNSQGKLTLAQSLALLSLCHLVVANDTGLMHAADALGIPPVAILGPTSGEMGCLPFHPLSKIIEEEGLWCRPCSKNGQAPCIRGKRVCLDRLTPDRVLSATRTLQAQIESGAKIS